LGGLLMTDHLEVARTAIVLRLIAQRNGSDLSRKDQFIAREIATLLNVLLLEKKVGK
jgi:D-alanyl-D-alanine carboxypeptidase